MANNNDGGAAFPSAVPIVNGAREVDGLTKRDWFAGQMMPALFADGQNSLEAARFAYEYADAMLAERAAEQEAESDER